MNAFLWTLQVALAFLFVAGGAYKTFWFAEVAKTFTAIPFPAWRALGVLEMIGGVLLVAPGVLSRIPTLTPLAAAVLAVEATALALVYGRTSFEVAAENPLVWSVGLALVAAFVAYGRYSARPLT
jgi:uncharacterized membrane protein YphA (DoxX/SURF4 family)